MNLRRWTSVALLLSSCAAVAAPENITPGEIARIPEYCPDAQLFSARGTPDAPTARQARWISLMGKPFWAIHHYCWAQVSANRAAQAGVSKLDREGLLTSAINDINYVIRYAPPDFVLLPELYTHIGDYYVRLDKPVDAAVHFEKAIAAKRDYWPPYLSLARLQPRIGRPQLAAEILREGLKEMPGQPQLQQALDRLTAAAKPAGRKASTP